MISMEMFFAIQDQLFINPELKRELNHAINLDKHEKAKELFEKAVSLAEAEITHKLKTQSK